MTRKVSILLLLSHLTIFAGCRQIPYYETDSDHVFDGRRVKREQPLSTAAGRDDEPRTPAKLPSGPTIAAEAKKPSTGVPGVVTVESPAQAPPQKIAFQDPPPLPLVEKRGNRESVVEALDYFMKGHHAEAIKALSVYEEDKQQVLLRWLPICAMLVNKRIGDLTTQEVGFLNKQLDGLRDSLLPRSELIITKMCFCKEVRGFASFDALPENHQFLTGSQDRIGELVQLYIELKNFASEPTKDGQFVTKLSCLLELHDQAGKKVWSKPLESNETTLRRSARLTDFYSRYGFYVPALPAGTYRLTLHVADETNSQLRRVAERSVAFQVTPVANQPGLR
ncbi:MAG: hypothetical protein HY289_13715 [Planctomycetes bacterium]|nr:hypothetical protein [Planctomycetota bacterium]